MGGKGCQSSSLASQVLELLLQRGRTRASASPVLLASVPPWQPLRAGWVQLGLHFQCQAPGKGFKIQQSAHPLDFAPGKQTPDL